MTQEREYGFQEKRFIVSGASSGIGKACAEALLTKKSFDDTAVRQHSESIIPVGRIAQPEDIDNVALFLFSDMADYINDGTIFVNSGFVLLK